VSVPRRRRWAVVAATAIMVGAPGAAFWIAPASGASGGAPGSQLAGINTDSTSTAARVVTFTPGLAPTGNAVTGTIVEADMPYATSNAGTGPTTGGTAALVWPGDVAANLGNAAHTFAPTFPATLANLLNDPVAAHSAYPAQLHTPAKSSFPPGAPAGVGTATTSSSAGNSTSRAAVSDLPLLGSKKGPLIDVASTTTDSSVTVNASSVSAQAETHIGHITIAGVVQIDGIASTAFASSDGVNGRHSNTLHIGGVTVAGVAASIGPNGITLNDKAQHLPIDVVNLANTTLSALQQAGLVIRLVPADGVDSGDGSSATSGSLQILFNDPNIPNLGALIPQVPIPLPNSFGFEVDLGGSQADAAATQLPGATSVPPASNGSPGTSSGGGNNIGGTGTTGGIPGGPSVTTTGPGSGTPIVAAPAATVLGLPIHAAWIVIAFLLSLLAAGPLLAYANWQLLRGRSS
jgi:hypothetical protein